MPNGGDTIELCEKAEPFYKKIQGALEKFVKDYSLWFTPWYHEMPLFLLEWPDPGDLKFQGIRRSIHVEIDPFSPDEAIVTILGHAFSDRGGVPPGSQRRLVSFFIMRGRLPRDESRITYFLTAAAVVLAQVNESDLLSVTEWQAQQSKQTPFVDLGA